MKKIKKKSDDDFKISVNEYEISAFQKIETAQKEMEILSGFLMDNAKIIIWIRGIFFTIWMAIIGFVLKAFYIDDKSHMIEQHRCLLIFLLLIIIIIAFILEFTIQVQQVFLTNRVTQLDRAINNATFTGEEAIKLQKVFIAKKKIELPIENFHETLSLIWNTVKAPTFFIFYLVMLIFWLIFSCLLIDP